MTNGCSSSHFFRTRKIYPGRNSQEGVNLEVLFILSIECTISGTCRIYSYEIHEIVMGSLTVDFHLPYPMLETDWIVSIHDNAGEIYMAAKDEYDGKYCNNTMVPTVIVILE